MSFRTRQILVAIRDERRVPRAQLRKAAALARASGAGIELYHAINEPIALDAMRRGSVAGKPIREIIEAVAQRSQKRLERLAALKEFRGLQVACAAAWDFPPHEAVIRRALAIEADLVVAAAQPKGIGNRFLLANTDWELIRHCPCPVLVVRSARVWKRPAVVASIDPLHAHDKPAALDRRILEAGRYVARELRGTLHAFHAHMPLTVVAPAPAGQALAFAISPEIESAHLERVTKIFNGIAARYGVVPRRRHLEMGIVPDELAKVVRETAAGLVVMGAISRSGFRRFLIGNTAERIVDRIDCDILVVKPRGFLTRVPKRKSLAWLGG